MTKTMEEWKLEALEKRNEERKRFLNMSEHQVSSLSVPDQYQWMRYQREVEAAKWLADLRRGIPSQPVEEPKQTKYRKPFKSVQVKDRWGD